MATAKILDSIYVYVQYEIFAWPPYTVVEGFLPKTVAVAVAAMETTCSAKIADSPTKTLDANPAAPHRRHHSLPEPSILCCSRPGRNTVLLYRVNASAGVR